MNRIVPISLLLTLLLFGIASGIEGGGAETVTIQLKWKHAYQFAGYYAAVENGYFAEEGLEVTLVQRKGLRDPGDSVLNGEADYGVSDSGLVLAALQGKPLVLVAQVFQHSPLVLFAHRDSDIRSAYHFAGKRIAMDSSGPRNTRSPLIGD